jgi:cytochrome c-type biogenesis protein CcmF
VSREAAFLINNWILLFSAFFVLFATMFPTLSEAVTGTRITVAGPFYNKWMAPIGLILLFLTGVGPLLAWRKSTMRNLRDQFMIPIVFAVVVGGGLYAMGLHVWSSGMCFALAAFVFGTIAQEFWRGTSIRKKNTGRRAHGDDWPGWPQAPLRRLRGAPRHRAHVPRLSLRVSSSMNRCC